MWSCKTHPRSNFRFTQERRQYRGRALRHGQKFEKCATPTTSPTDLTSIHKLFITMIDTKLNQTIEITAGQHGFDHK